MKVQISGKNVDIGDSLRTQIEDRLDNGVHKYFDGSVSGSVTLMREGINFKVDCVIHLSSGITLQSKAVDSDAYICFDKAADKLEKRLRRYKSKLKDHHNGKVNAAPYIDAADYIINISENDEEREELNPVIIAENTAVVHELTVGEAVMRLDLSEDVFLFFKNAGNGGLNVVYRRDDGNVGWIDPSRDN